MTQEQSIQELNSKVPFVIKQLEGLTHSQALYVLQMAIQDLGNYSEIKK